MFTNRVTRTRPPNRMIFFFILNAAVMNIINSENKCCIRGQGITKKKNQINILICSTIAFEWLEDQRNDILGKYE
ncbi:hypothetical protein BpHYR1_029498 [Brachionus plicatilis]|uniref:Uncharacterized protein n=1 Tax=Brachionus plicatilis TaxID=10195 RepID=A0A3M7RXR4_BRAPC|nr:hypothetical protein BpHYR1_029498 [Brachionus plicatilis]